MNIEVVLTDNDPKLGKRGQVIKVSSGYAQNYLFPNKKAKPATPANLKSFEEQKLREAKEETLRLERGRALASKISQASLTLDVLTGEEEKLYGAVTSQDIAQALAKEGIVLEKKDIHLEEPIKKLGAYQVPVKLHKDISANLKLWVVKKKA